MNSPLKGKPQNRPNDTKSFPVPPKQWYQGQKGNQNQTGVNAREELQNQTVNKSVRHKLSSELYHIKLHTFSEWIISATK